MTTLITGGTGFIGAELVRQLLDADVDDDLHITHRRGDFTRLGTAVDLVSAHRIDLSDTDALNDLVQTVVPDRIFHFGAVLTGPGQANPQLAVRANAFGTYALLEAARTAGVPQMVFASSIGTYGRDIQDPAIGLSTVQRPLSVYGVTKVFGENLGSFYRTKYGLDFRGLRYPALVGPGVTTPSVVQYTSWMIEEPAKGNPFTAAVTPEFAVPIVYYKDAARAAITLSQASADRIKTVNYLVDGLRPTPTARQIAGAVEERIPGARIEFAPDPATQAILDAAMKPLDDSEARSEWGWVPEFGLSSMIDDFLLELAKN